jgi:hypothetical protein
MACSLGNGLLMKVSCFPKGYISPQHGLFSNIGFQNQITFSKAIIFSLVTVGMIGFLHN